MAALTLSNSRVPGYITIKYQRIILAIIAKYGFSISEWALLSIVEIFVNKTA